MAGAAGIEPANHGIKTRCLTTWLRPNKAIREHIGTSGIDATAERDLGRFSEIQSFEWSGMAWSLKSVSSEARDCANLAVDEQISKSSADYVQLYQKFAGMDKDNTPRPGLIGNLCSVDKTMPNKRWK